VGYRPIRLALDGVLLTLGALAVIRFLLRRPLLAEVGAGDLAFPWGLQLLLLMGLLVLRRGLGAGPGDSGRRPSLEALVLLGAFFCLAGAIVALLYVQKLAAPHGKSFLPIALIAYGLGSAVAVGITRGSEEWGPAASRYFPDLALGGVGFLLAAASLVATKVAYRANEKRAAGLLVAFTSLALVSGHAATYHREWVVAPTRAAAFDAMRALTLDGRIRSEGDWRMLQSDEAWARAGLEIQHRLCLGPVRSSCRAR
jgi:hypothetical protein